MTARDAQEHWVDELVMQWIPKITSVKVLERWAERTLARIKDLGGGPHAIELDEAFRQRTTFEMQGRRFHASNWEQSADLDGITITLTLRSLDPPHYNRHQPLYPDSGGKKK